MRETPEQIPFDFAPKVEGSRVEVVSVSSSRECAMCGNEAESKGRCWACQSWPEKE